MSAMAVGSLLRHHWRQHRWALAPMAAGLALFEFAITQVAPAPDEVSWMSRILAFVPPQLLALAGNEVSATSPGGFIAIGYGHPFFLLLVSALAVRVSSGALAGEIGRGTMDLLAARPVDRWQHVTAAFVAAAAGLALLLAAAWAGTAFGLSERPLGVEATAFLPIAAAAWVLFVAWAAIGLLVSATRREGGSALAWTSGLISSSFVLEYLARLWQRVSALRPLSLFAYYRPQQIISAGLAGSDVIVLAGVAVVAIALALAVFQRRDL
jgi:ABC-2 type transport system permease protein